MNLSAAKQVIRLGKLAFGGFAGLRDSAQVRRVTVRDGAGMADNVEYKQVSFKTAGATAPHPDGGVYLVDGATLHRIASDGKASVLSTQPGGALRGGAVDQDGYFYSGCGNGIVKLSPEGARLPAPAASLAGLSQDLALALDAQGRIYLADRERNVLWRIEAGGAVSRVAGAGTATHFTQLGAIAAHPRGGVVVADKHAIRRVSAGGIVSTVAGSVEEHGHIDGAAAEARFQLPDGLAVDAAGTVYVADTDNRVIRKIGTDGAVTTVAGTLAGFFLPRALTLDALGNLLVSDADALRSISPAGVVSTLAGGLAL